MASPWGARRARSVVLAAIVLVLAGTVASYLNRQRRNTPAPPGPVSIAEDVGQQTHSFSLSKTLGGNTLYTITAEEVTNFQDTGQALLHNVVVLIFGKDGSRRDRITSPESYYDPAVSSVWIPGEVEMQFDLPTPGGAPGTGSEGGKAGSEIPISIYTSQLSFERSTGVASTDAAVRFVFAQGEGTSVGAAYDPEKQVLTLKSQVRFDLAGRARPGEKTLVRAGTVHFVRETGKAILENSVEITRGTQQIRAARGEIQLDDQRRVQRTILAGDVVAIEETSTELRQARAESAAVSLDESGRIRSLDLHENVSWSMESLPRGSQRDGRAQHVELFFREPAGQLQRVRAERDVRMTFRGDQTRTTAADTHTLSGGEAEMTMTSDGRTMQQVKMASSPKLEILPGNAASERRTVTGDQFEIRLDGRGELSEFRAQGNVRAVSEQTASPELRRETKSDSLEASFQSSQSSQSSGNSAGEGSGSLDRIRQWGHFEYRDPERQARAEQATYDAASETVVLNGDPVVWNSEGRLTAAQIELESRTGEIRAEGNVSSTFFQQSSAGSSNAEPLHVVADRMRYEAAEKRSRFEGHAKLWQGESFLVEAELIDWRQRAGELTASRKVYSVFRPSVNGNASTSAGAADDRKGPSTIVITADSLLYQQAPRLATYDGGIRMQSTAGVLTASKLEIVFQEWGQERAASSSASVSIRAGQIERAVAQDQVKIVEGERVATADRAEYIPARDEVHLYGRPAKVADIERGTVEGAELTYFLADDRIQVQGSPGSPTETRWQVAP